MGSSAGTAGWTGHVQAVWSCNASALPLSMENISLCGPLAVWRQRASPPARNRAQRQLPAQTGGAAGSPSSSRAAGVLFCMSIQKPQLSAGCKHAADDLGAHKVTICAADRPLRSLLHAVGFANILGATTASQVASCPGKQRISASRFKSPMQAYNDCLHMINLPATPP